MSTQKKDIDKYLQLYEAYKREVFSIALTYLQFNENLAEEVLQEVFTKLYSYSDTYDEEYIGQWIITVTVNESINYYKKYVRERVDGSSDWKERQERINRDPEIGVLEEEENKEKEKFVEELFQKVYEINPRWHEVLTLVYSMQMKPAEAAKKMGVSAAVFYRVLYRAKEWLKKQYNESEDKKK